MDVVAEDEIVVVRQKQLLSRFLYPNPVCMLTSSHMGKQNVMVISWLTPINNDVCSFHSNPSFVSSDMPKGDFICSMNVGRHSASLVLGARRFGI